MFKIPMQAHFRHYVRRALQKYNEIFNRLIYDPCNCPLKIGESIGTPTPKVRVHLGVWMFIPSHSPKFLGASNVTFGFHSWLAPLQALALVVSLRLGLQHCSCCALDEP
jgi:hypothetical protein